MKIISVRLCKKCIAYAKNLLPLIAKQHKKKNNIRGFSHSMVMYSIALTSSSTPVRCWSCL